MYINHILEDFLGGPTVKTQFPMQGGMNSIPSWGAKIPHATCPKKNKKSCLIIL